MWHFKRKIELRKRKLNKNIEKENEIIYEDWNDNFTTLFIEMKCNLMTIKYSQSIYSSIKLH